MIEAFTYTVFGAIAVISGIIIYQLITNSVLGTVLRVKRELDVLRKENGRCYTTINQLRDSLEDAAVAVDRDNSADLLFTAYEDELCKVRASNANLRKRNDTLYSNYSAVIQELRLHTDLVAKYCDEATEMKIKMAAAGYLDGGKSSNISSKANQDD